LFKEFFRQHDKYIKSSIFDPFKVISPAGLVFSEGKMWKKHRKIVSMAFHYNFLREITPEIVKISDEFLNKLKKTSMKKLDIMNEVQTITAEVVGRLFFGEAFADYKIDGQPLADFVAELTKEAGDAAMSLGQTLFGVNYVKLGIEKKHRELLKNQAKFRDFAREIKQ